MFEVVCRKRPDPSPQAFREIAFKVSLKVASGSVVLEPCGLINEGDDSDPREAANEDLALGRDVILLFLQKFFTAGGQDGLANIGKDSGLVAIRQKAICRDEFDGVLGHPTQMGRDKGLKPVSGHKFRQSVTAFATTAASRHTERADESTLMQDAATIFENEAWNQAVA
jgi:hypothetical protein